MTFKSAVGWVTFGFLLIWIIEIRRVSFADSYWLMMLFLASLMYYAYLRYQIIMSNPKSDQNNNTGSKPQKPKTQSRKK
jgi:hypothetical protein